MNMEAITRRFGHSLYVGSMHPARCTWRGAKHQGVSMGKLRYRGPDTLHSCAFVTARCGMSQALRVVRHGALAHVLHRDQGLLGVHVDGALWRLQDAPHAPSAELCRGVEPAMPAGQARAPAATRPGRGRVGRPAGSPTRQVGAVGLLRQALHRRRDQGRRAVVCSRAQLLGNRSARRSLRELTST